MTRASTATGVTPATDEVAKLLTAHLEGTLTVLPALEAELTSGRLAAILDVTDPEPMPAGHPLLALPNVFVTPHVAGASGNELARLAELAVVEVERFVAGELPRYPVTAADMDRIA